MDEPRSRVIFISQPNGPFENLRSTKPMDNSKAKEKSKQVRIHFEKTITIGNQKRNEFEESKIQWKETKCAEKSISSFYNLTINRHWLETLSRRDGEKKPNDDKANRDATSDRAKIGLIVPQTR